MFFLICIKLWQIHQSIQGKIWIVILYFVNRVRSDNALGGSIQLTLNNLLIKLEGHVSSHWYKFGLAIGIPEDILEQLQDYSDKDALVEILDYWLKNHSSGQPTWKDVATALENAGFNDINVE